MPINEIQPDTTLPKAKKVKTYTAQLIYNTNVWALDTEIFNNLGTVTVSGAIDPKLDSTALFTLNKTFVSAMPVRTSSQFATNLKTLTANTVEPLLGGSSANGDKILIKIEVYI